MLALAVRAMPVDQADAVAGDPMAAVENLVFLGLVGIIDPLRPEAIEAVRVAHRAGIDVRMITGDHLVTAQAIAAELDLGPGGMTGTDFAATSDDQLADQLPALHVFGRVSPQDKLRLVQLMQGRGDIVAMTGDAVNDAAALKQADIGVAMGSGSEVSKQAAKMILTDDNFATLVHAVELGRGIFARITAYIGYQLTQLFGLVSMFLLATILNINEGVALLPLQVLFLNFTLAVIPVIIITIDEPEPGLMDLPPRDPRERIFNRTTATRWIGLGLLLGVLSLLPLAFGPDEPSAEVASVSVTMAYAVMGLATGLAGLVMRKTTASAFARPVVPAALLVAAGVAITIASTEVGFLQGFLKTTELSGGQWATCMGLALLFALAVSTRPAPSRPMAPGAGGGGTRPAELDADGADHGRRRRTARRVRSQHAAAGGQALRPPDRAGPARGAHDPDAARRCCGQHRDRAGLHGGRRDHPGAAQRRAWAPTRSSRRAPAWTRWPACRCRRPGRCATAA